MHDPREFHLRSLAPGEALELPFGGEPYPALVWATLRASAEDRERIAAALLASGCRYAVCGGVDCRAWEDAADAAFLRLDPVGAEDDERFVMTTSHPGEPEEEVVRFFVHDTRFGGHDFSRYLVLVIGRDGGVERRLAAALRAETSPAGGG